MNTFNFLLMTDVRNLLIFLALLLLSAYWVGYWTARTRTGSTPSQVHARGMVGFTGWLLHFVVGSLIILALLDKFGYLYVWP